MNLFVLRFLSAVLWIIGLIPSISNVEAATYATRDLELQQESPSYDVIQSLPVTSQGLLDLSLVTVTSLDYDTTMDVAIFEDPTNNSSFFSIGLGSPDGELCCSTAAQQAETCLTAGRLIVQDSFEGTILSMFVPSMTNLTPGSQDNHNVIDNLTHGHYSLLFANCNEGSSHIRIAGSVQSLIHFSSKEAYQSVTFYALLTVAYIILIPWYRKLLYHRNSNGIRREEFLLAIVMVLGAIEAFLSTVHYANGPDKMYGLTGMIVFIGVLEGFFFFCHHPSPDATLTIIFCTIIHKFNHPMVFDFDAFVIGSVNEVASVFKCMVALGILTHRISWYAHNSTLLRQRPHLIFLLMVCLPIFLGVLILFGVLICYIADFNVSLMLEELKNGAFFGLVTVAVLWLPNPTNGRDEMVLVNKDMAMNLDLMIDETDSLHAKREV